MAKLDELLAHGAQLRAQVLDDIKAMRRGGYRIVRNNEDITAAWLQDRQACADKLGSAIEAHGKPPIYIYGAF